MHIAQPVGFAFAPANIALCKYWGKRDTVLNLPSAGSLSISLGPLGAHTRVSLQEHPYRQDDKHAHNRQDQKHPCNRQDQIFLNGTLLAAEHHFSKRVSTFLDLFRLNVAQGFCVETHSNIPIAAGLASSACGFAALTLALDQLFDWQLSRSALSGLARLGSGSACRSLWQGFVEWHKGSQADGSDSIATPLSVHWPELRVGLLILNPAEKALSSRAAMQQTVATSGFYGSWILEQEKALIDLKHAVQAQDFEALGSLAEANALALHALMLTAKPAILYSNAQTIESMHQIWSYRKAGLALYFTQDAGPNLKLLFLAADEAQVRALFPALQIVSPFETPL